VSARGAIENVLARYAWAFDMDELGGMGDCFTEDAKVEFGSGLAVGREAVVAGLEERRDVFRARQVAPWHLMTNILIGAETDTHADVKCFFTFFTKAAGAPAELSSIGYYDDRFVNDGGTWRVRLRRVVSGGKI
jgi:hypothetical protein